MSATSKRKNTMEDDSNPKRAKKVECPFQEKCYRLNPTHFKEYSHKHLEAILDSYPGFGDFQIPSSLNAHLCADQLNLILRCEFYIPGKNCDSKASYSQSSNQSTSSGKESSTSNSTRLQTEREDSPHTPTSESGCSSAIVTSTSSCPQSNLHNTQIIESEYRPIVPPTRRIEDYFSVVVPPGNMAAKHAASHPYYIFYTTIKDSKPTHTQQYSITFQEILDHSLGELKCSLQINFMVEIGWLLAQYYFAGYSEKKLTILYGEEDPDVKNISLTKPHVDSHHIRMPVRFGKHHTKMMILCYEDRSLRVVISTANLYQDDWENRTQGIWFSPKCPELPPGSMPHDGESPTSFKKSLLNYLHHYDLPALKFYLDTIKRCDFSHINVFLVASVPGSHHSADWGMLRVGSLLRDHCEYAPPFAPLVAQASSLGSFGKSPTNWLTGDFLRNFTKSKKMHPVPAPPPLNVIYPSLENVRESHDGILGGLCLPYAADTDAKQPWLKSFLYQWQAHHTARTNAMPHIKSYTRIYDGKAVYFILTSANLSKAAWGQVNKGDEALRIMSYEAGVMFLPTFVIKKGFFPLEPDSDNRLIIPYDLPPVKYSTKMQPWVVNLISDKK